MVLEGKIDERNQLWVTVTVGGRQKKQTVMAIVDTGFNGELLLPLPVAIPLGLELTSMASYKLADGSVSNQMLFSGSLSWGTTTRPVTINVVGSDTALIGGGLLHDYILLADFNKKKLVIKEPK